MLANIAFDLLIGSVPVIGDLIDAVFRCNQRNAALLRRSLADRYDLAHQMADPPTS